MGCGGAAIPGHTVWRVTPVQVIHPTSFFVVERERDGQLLTIAQQAGVEPSRVWADEAGVHALLFVATSTGSGGSTSLVPAGTSAGRWRACAPASGEPRDANQARRSWRLQA